MDKKLSDLLSAGRRAHRAGDLDEAEACYQSVLAIRADDPDALYLLGLIAYRRGRLEEAVERVSRALDVNPDHVMAHASLGQIYQDCDDHQGAVRHLRRSAELRPDDPRILNALGVSLTQCGDLEAAIATYKRSIQIDPKQPEALNNLGNVQRLVGAVEDARASYAQSLKLNPGFAEAYNNLGVLNHESRNLAHAIENFATAVKYRAEYAQAYNNLGAALSETGQYDKALSRLRRATSIDSEFIEARINTGIALHNLGRHREARVELDRVLSVRPDHILALWARCIAELESVYETRAAIDASRAGYIAHLETFLDATKLDGPATRAGVVQSVGSLQPFLLPYQGLDDLELQSRYGDCICEAMASQSPAMRRDRRNGNLRVGIVSGHFYDHSNWKAPVSGWLQYLGREFDVYGYYTGYRVDDNTRLARTWCREFRSGMSTRQFATAIIDDRIDVLIYPEVGMHPVTTRLAAQRLAPVQCASWGHPVTTGLPTMDYFLSSELMEPDGAQSYYRERLVQLPGLSIVCRKPQTASSMPPTRSRFGVEDSDVVFLCVQNLSKYLPEHDVLLARIARQVERAKLVFIASDSASTKRLARRMRNVFAAENTDFDACAVFLPRQDPDAWIALNRCADVFLDTHEWSGCNSTLEAIACDLPFITLPGRFMRGRHGEAIARKMGYDNAIATDEGDFVLRAARLGNDRLWRERQAREINQHKELLYNDAGPARELAAFIRAVARA